MFFIIEKCTEIVLQVCAQIFCTSLILAVGPALLLPLQRHQDFFLSRDSSHRTYLVSLIFLRVI